MDPVTDSIEHLTRQRDDLASQIEALEAVVGGSSTSGIREFRRQRLRQLESRHRSVAERIRRLEARPQDVIRAYAAGGSEVRQGVSV